MWQNQLLFDEIANREDMQKLDSAVDELKRRYGNNAIMWGGRSTDEDTSQLDIKGDNTVHPISFFHR